MSKVQDKQAVVVPPKKKANKTVKAMNGDGSVYFDAKANRWVAAAPLPREVRADGSKGPVRLKKSKHLTEGQAKTALRELLRKVHQGKYDRRDEEKPKRMPTLGECVERWLSLRINPSDRKTATKDKYEWAARKHVIPALGDRPVNEVTNSEIQEFIWAKLEERTSPQHKPREDGKTQRGKEPAEPRTLSVNTVVPMRTVLISTFRVAIKDGLINANPATDLEFPKVKPLPAKESLDDAEVAKFLKACEGHEFGDLYRFILYTGCRVGEATGISWADLATDFRAVTIRAQLKRVKGEGMQRVSGTKNGKDRIMPLPAPVTKFFEGLKLTGGKCHSDALVFLTADATSIRPENARKKLKALCRQAGIPELKGPHKLRKTFATAIAKNVNKLAAQTLLDHAEEETTDSYVDTKPLEYRAEVDRLPSIYGDGGAKP